ncbi:hypothetical protein QQF64_020032 [Cirrhinus molitorella]|uniref:Uncharacterized protein n=1 Tax=Cirrhinus molitorella TaxID=172907 RepID=A0ABR3LJM9_9TELE
MQIKTSRGQRVNGALFMRRRESDTGEGTRNRKRRQVRGLGVVVRLEFGRDLPLAAVGGSHRDRVRDKEPAFCCWGKKDSSSSPPHSCPESNSGSTAEDGGLRFSLESQHGASALLGSTQEEQEMSEGEEAEAEPSQTSCPAYEELLEVMDRATNFAGGCN